MATALLLVHCVLLGTLGFFMPSALGQYRHLGCFKDKHDRAIKSLVKTYRSGAPSGDQAVRLCQMKTLSAGFTVFGVQNGSECWTSANANATYNKYGTSTNCVNGNKGGPYANAVYRTDAIHFGHSKVGCFRDTATRAIPPLEGQDAVLDGRYEKRKNAITKCAQAVRARGYQVFALQNGGWCASSATAHVTYNKYGTSSACRGDGEGGPWANEVYAITVENYGYRFLGCYQDDSAARAMPQKISDFRSLSNKDVVDLCYLDALKGGYKAFGVQYGGQCFTGPQAHLTYKRYGGSGGCRHGKGGTWANDVYFIDVSTTYVHIGCFADSTHNRALPTQTGSYLVTRNSDAVRLCYLDTLVRGWPMFGVQNNGVCWSSPSALQTYSKHGGSTACSGGKGALLASDVYVMNVKRDYLGCTYGWVKYNEFCYRMFTVPKNWNKAKDSCKGQGGYLVTVATQWEQDFMERFLRVKYHSTTHVWIGLNDLKNKGDYRWVNNEQAQYFNWDKNNDYWNRDCVTMTGLSGKWFGQSCSQKFRYVCMKKYQYSHPPAHKHEEGTNVGAIIGGVIGGWVALIICCCNKRNRQPPNPRPNPPANPRPSPTTNTVANEAHTPPPPSAPPAHTDVEGGNVNVGNDSDSTLDDTSAFDPPPPFQDSWAIPEQPPPSYDEAIRM